MSSFGTPAQQQLHKKFFVPFFHWQDDAKLREWLREQDPDELEQYLDWFDWTNHRDRETLGRQELRKLRSTTAKLGSLSSGELPSLAKLKNKPLIEWAGGARVTLAIVFTDIVDSTALGIQLGDAAMSEVRRRHFAQSTALVAKYAGREIKTIGDSVMAVFRSAGAKIRYSGREAAGSERSADRRPIDWGLAALSRRPVQRAASSRAHARALSSFCPEVAYHSLPV